MENGRVEKYHEIEGYELPEKIGDVGDKMYNFEIYANENKLEIRVYVKGIGIKFIFQGEKEKLIKRNLISKDDDITKIAFDIKQTIQYCQHKVEKDSNNDYLKLTVNGREFNCIQIV